MASFTGHTKVEIDESDLQRWFMAELERLQRGLYINDKREIVHHYDDHPHCGSPMETVIGRVDNMNGFIFVIKLDTKAPFTAEEVTTALSAYTLKNALLEAKRNDRAGVAHRR